MAARAKDPLPQEVLAGLEGRLSDALARAYLLRGEERWFRERAVARIAARAEGLGYEVSRHDGSDPDFSGARLLDDLSAVPMFAAGRCIVLREPEAAKKPQSAPLLEKREDGQPSAFTAAALAWLAGEAPGCLVISSRGMRADHALAKALVKAGGESLSFRKLYDTPPPWNPDPSQTELAQWLLRRARELGVRLAPQDAGYVAAATGNDLAALETQLEKLRHGGGAALREIVGWDSSSAPWALVDPFLAGDLPRVLMGLQALYASGFESSGKRERAPAALAAVLLGSLRGPLRQTVVGARALAAGRSPAAAAEAAGVKGFQGAQQAFETRLRERGAPEWERMLEDLGELERRSRSGAELDHTDLVQLALRWARSARPAGPTARPAPPAGRGGARR